jgi:hypothetical protein
MKITLRKVKSVAIGEKYNPIFLHPLSFLIIALLFPLVLLAMLFLYATSMDLM